MKLLSHEKIQGFSDGQDVWYLSSEKRQETEQTVMPSIVPTFKGFGSQAWKFDPLVYSCMQVHSINSTGDQVNMYIGRTAVEQMPVSVPRSQFRHQIDIGIGDRVVFDYDPSPTSFLDGAARRSSRRSVMRTSEPIKQIGMFRKVRIDFKPDGKHRKIALHLPLLKLHKPDFRDCLAEAAIVDRTADEETATFSFFGIGGGAGVSGQFRLQQKYIAKKRCIKIVLPATLTLRYGHILLNGMPIAYGIRGDLDCEANDTKWLYIKESEDLCRHNFSKKAHFKRLDLRALQSDDARQAVLAEIEQISKGRLRLGISGGKALPLTMDIAFERALSKKLTLKTLLSPGALYTSYWSGAGGFPELAWQTSQ